MCRLWQKQVMKGKAPGPETLPHILSAPGCRLALAAPRGHAKSTVMSLQNVLDADLQRRHPDIIIRDILDKARWLQREYGGRYTAFGAETNQFQWFLKERLAAESAAQGIYLPITEVRAASDKVLRIQTLQPDIRNGYLRFCRDQTELLRQLEQFPLGRHDDGPDALEGAVRLCKQGPRLSTLPLRM